MPRILTWSVDGMRCASCERNIAQSLRDLPGVEEVDVSLRQRRAGLRLADNAPEPSLDQLNRLFESHGYRFDADRQPPSQGATSAVCSYSPRPTSHSLSRRLLRALILVAAFGLAASILWGPLQHVVPNASSAATATAMLGLGIVASLSSCLATTGGFLLAYTSKNGKTNALAIHAGRLSAFVIGGALLGGIGGALPKFTPSAAGIVSIVFGGILLWAGLHMLDLAPALSTIGIRPPERLTALADRSSTSNGGVIADTLAGAATFVLPCGFTQTAQMLAVASGSAMTGALLLASFAIGTLPALAGVTAFGRSASGATARNLKFAAGAILVVFSVIHIDGGLTLVGSRLTLLGAAQAVTAARPSSSPSAATDPAEQIVRMSVNGGSFSPNSLTVKSGIPVKWIIDGTNAGGCTGSIVVPSLGIEKVLARGENVVTFTPSAPGAIPFSCGMGMVRGTFNVT